jgi:hypothetical protein
MQERLAAILMQYWEGERPSQLEDILQSLTANEGDMEGSYYERDELQALMLHEDHQDQWSIEEVQVSPKTALAMAVNGGWVGHDRPIATFKVVHEDEVIGDACHLLVTTDDEGEVSSVAFVLNR